MTWSAGKYTSSPRSYRLCPKSPLVVSPTGRAATATSASPPELLPGGLLICRLPCPVISADCPSPTLCLLKTSSSAQSLMFPRSGSSPPTLMRHLLYVLLATARASLKPQRELALENLALRQQLAILHRTSKRPKLTKADRAFWVAVCGQTGTMPSSS